MTHPIDDAIKTVADGFAAELQRLREMRGLKTDFQADTFMLAVSVGDKGGMSIVHTHGYGTEVRAADFQTLIDEVYRRAGFDQREAGRLQALGDRLLPVEQ